MFAAVLTVALAASPEPMACDLHALDPAQRARHQVLSQKLRTAVIELRELDAGFGLHVDAAKMPLTELAEWIDAERRCCRFLTLALAAEPHQGPVWLRLSGPAGAKDFLRAELR
ncbi:MAG: hypothetical protein JST54_30335 [Deltaproteobacteria bacterium]|nr:hypothetical protein [Deltaproteobacteria bacterium]